MAPRVGKPCVQWQPPPPHLHLHLHLHLLSNLHLHLSQAAAAAAAACLRLGSQHPLGQHLPHIREGAAQAQHRLGPQCGRSQQAQQARTQVRMHQAPVSEGHQSGSPVSPHHRRRPHLPTQGCS